MVAVHPQQKNIVHQHRIQRRRTIRIHNVLQLRGQLLHRRLIRRYAKYDLRQPVQLRIRVLFPIPERVHIFPHMQQGFRVEERLQQHSYIGCVEALLLFGSLIFDNGFEELVQLLVAGVSVCAADGRCCGDASVLRFRILYFIGNCVRVKKERVN